MTMLDTGFDAYFYPVELALSQLRVTAADTENYILNIPADLYAMVSGTEYPSLLQTIVDLLDAQVPAQTWYWERIGFLVGGVTLAGWGVQLASDQAFSVDALNSAPAFSELFGWEFDTRPAFDTGGFGFVLSPDAPHGGAWRTLRPPQRRPLNTIAEQYVSGGRGQGLHLTRWGADRIRSVLYRNIPAAHVIEGRASIEAYAQVANLGTGWTMNQFYDLWDAGISRYQPVYAAYNLSDMPMDITTVDRWEILQSPQGSRYADEFTSCITRASRSAEHYDVEFAMRAIGGNDTWG